MNSIAFFSVFCVFIGAPAIVLGFIYLTKKQKNDIVKLNYQKEIVELELEKEKTRMLLLKEENRKYDRMIDEKISDISRNAT
jgi:hypothetical protein